MARSLFDLRALFVAVDAERDRRGLSWAALSQQVGVAPSTIRRFANADDAEADGVLATLQWLDAIPERFVADAEVNGTPLSPASDGHVRVDMDMVAKANGDPRGANGRTRTTIQTLVAAANRSGQPIASLTRRTDL
ncbi:MAG: hypothetical protein AAF467_05650 [Actinomycetota bacterium]